MLSQVTMPQNRTNKLFRDKQVTNKVQLMYLRKGHNCVFERSQEARKVQCMYLAFKDIQISGKKGTQWSES